jgi:ribosomal protein S18 acetylase RimI-like enzyme
MIEQVQLQRAGSADLELLLELMRGYYRDDHLDFELVRQRSALLRLLEEPQWGRVWLIRLPDRIVGYVAVCFGFSLELGGNDAYVDEMYVVPEARGRGVGRHALQQLHLPLAELGIRALHLEVDQHNHAAQRMYSALGYRQRDRYFLMSRDLGN